MEIKFENAKAAYDAADESGKKLLAMLIPELKEPEKINQPKKDNRPITERVKTFDDAVNELGDKNPLVQESATPA